MKKNYLLAFVLPLALAFTSCGGSFQNGTIENVAEATEEEKTEVDKEIEASDFPWYFPDWAKNDGLAEGQTVLSIHSFYPDKLKESNDPANETYIFYNASLKSIGEKTSVVTSMGQDIEMPNALIIPIPQGQTAKKGDIVLTWWQSGSGMERAIVTDDSNPSSPKVCYLDMDWTDDGKGFANEHANEQLKPNTFTVLKNNEWQPGAQVTLYSDGSYQIFTLINAADKYLLLSGWAGKIIVYKKEYCKLVPLEQEINVGDEVMANFVGSYRTGYKVTKVDKEIGRVWTTDSYGETKIFSILDVYKEE
ncbi:MAG: hypothetical protein J6W06_04760 [Bacteroidales bacterium]|jgi:hypothetical protein|nr:hypothetical protein [Bacteroidales bacterium]